MATVAPLCVIGGTGLDTLDTLRISRRETVSTPYGEPSAPVSFGLLSGVDAVFLARHGDSHQLPPHKINYRANVWALQQLGMQRVIGVAAVGGINAAMAPGELVIPDQIIDYTYDREHTFFAGDNGVEHVDFSYPYSEPLRQTLLKAIDSLGLKRFDSAVYAATQGPRLETAAEIQRLRRDGCDLVGMTGMPEAALAREAGLDYACCAVVVNWAAGLSDGVITMDEIRANLEVGLEKLKRLLGEIAGSAPGAG